MMERKVDPKNALNRMHFGIMTMAIILATAATMSLADLRDSHSFAQTNPGNNNATNAKDTFNLSGAISSLIYVPAPSSTNTTANNNMTNIKNITEQLSTINKFVLSGNWNLQAKEGKITDFNSSFTKVLADGNRWHTHDLVNFKQEGNSKAELTPDNSLGIKGKVDVKLNNTIPWKNADVNINISKGNTIAIKLNNEQTSNHFQGQSIYGIVRSTTEKGMNETK